MPQPMILGAWLLAGAVIAMTATWLARRYALRRQLIDQPGERRSHAAATPRGGGIAIVVVMLLAACVLAAANPSMAGAVGLAATGLVMVAGIGWIDDHRPLSPWLRLGIHVLAAGLLTGAIAVAGGSALDMVVAFVAAVVLANVWNFMDGIDGIAASQALLAGAAYALFAGHGPVLWTGAALAAACAGFLPFNFPKARIFLGDVGSGALGYTLAGLMAMASLRQDIGPRVLLLLPLLPFLLDASFTLLARIVRGEAWWQPHVQHAYQAWARRRGGHVGVTLAYAAVTVLLVAAMFAMQSWGSVRIMMVYMMFLAAGAVAWMLLKERRAQAAPDNFRDGNP